jgi:hypothetical protein
MFLLGGRKECLMVVGSFGDVNPAKTQVRDARRQAGGLCSHMDRPDLPRDKDYNGAQRWPLNIDIIRKTAVHTINYLT